MTRTTVNTSTIMGKNYNIINIRANNNNPRIDEEITITITVNDVYGDAVSGYQVQLYKDGVSMGNQYKANTNSQGVATFNYTMTDWDEHHFTVENSILPLRAKGWKLVETKESNKVKVYCDGSQVAVSVQNTFTLTANGQRTLTTISTQYAPNNALTTPYHPDAPNIHIVIENTGEMKAYNKTTSTSGIAKVYVTYPLLATMPQQ